MPLALRNTAPELRDRLTAELGPLMGARPVADPWPTGIPPLDAALGGGIPRGRLTELTGVRGVGKTALLRRVVAQVLRQGGWVAWIDATRTLTPAPWAELGPRFVVIRMPEVRRSAWTADVLLRSGVFGLVVLDGAPPLSRVQGVRLAQIARERQAACVVLEHRSPAHAPARRLPGSVRIHVADTAAHAASRSASQTPLRLTIEKGGVMGRAPMIEVPRVVVLARRLCPDPTIPDRRGVAHGTRRPWSARSNTSDRHAIDRDAAITSEREHPVTWGGLGVASADLYGTALPGHPARLAVADDRYDTAIGDRLPLETSHWTRERLRERHREWRDGPPQRPADRPEAIPHRRRTTLSLG
ncbi:MAG: hypothetical protein RLZZ621_2368 [Gemmatimonadota bacterium]|jgi:hypothetical protein